MSGFSDGSMANVGGLQGLWALLSNDTVTSIQWAEKFHRKQSRPEQKLCFAVMESVVYDITVGDQAKAWDALMWIKGDPDATYSFAIVCEALGLDESRYAARLIELYNGRKWTRGGKRRASDSIIGAVQREAKAHSGQFNARLLRRKPALKDILMPQIHVVLSQLADEGAIRKIGRGWYVAVA